MRVAPSDLPTEPPSPAFARARAPSPGGASDPTRDDAGLFERATPLVAAAENELADRLRTETLARLAAGLAHGLKNPLGVLTLGLAFLREHPLASDPALTEILVDMSDAVSRATAAMVELHELATPRAPLPIRGPIERPLGHALALARVQRCCARVALVEEMRGGPIEVVIDASFATQMLVNALLDVAEVTPAGGRVRVRTFALGPRAPEASGANDGRRRWVVCEVESVAATGAERAERTPDHSDGARASGTRGGLASARRLLEARGGWLRSTPGGGAGARVTVAFPAAE